MATISGPEAPRVAPGPASGPRVGAETSVGALVATLVRSARDMVAHTLEVAALESRLAGVTLATIAGIALGIVVLVLSTWGLLLAAGVRGLMELGLGPGSALLMAAAINLLVAVLLALTIPRLARRLTFNATRRVLGKMGADS